MVVSSQLVNLHSNFEDLINFAGSIFSASFNSEDKSMVMLLVVDAISKRSKLPKNKNTRGTDPGEFP